MYGIPVEETAKAAQANLLFTVTAEGERMLAEVRAGAKQLMDALKGVA